jgi:putative transcriptional regulator
VTPKRIIAIREKMQVSRERFAEIMGVSRRTVEGWEAGRRPSDIALHLLKLHEKNAALPEPVET